MSSVLLEVPSISFLALVGVQDVIFFLLQRQDLRDRLIRLAGSNDLQRTTQAINDGADRLSRYFLAQTLLNVVFGIVVATALSLIGVPNPALLGILAALLRFVPYIGAVIAAALPIALAITVAPDWNMALMTAALFLILEPLIGQIIEPLVFGKSTGLTPVAIIIAATFWTWLWGPIGLLLSTPLAVCLGVLGRHIPALRFVDILIGDEPPLSPAQVFYQRALAGNIDEAVDQAEQILKRQSLADLYDEIILKALILAQIDFPRGLLDHERAERINEAVRELIAATVDNEDVGPAPSIDSGVEKNAGDEESGAGQPTPGRLTVEELPQAWRGGAICCLAGRGPFDAIAARLFCQLVENHGMECRLVIDAEPPFSKVVHLDVADARIVCLSSIDLGSIPVYVRYSIRRLRKQTPNASVIACLWGHEAGDDRTRLSSAVNADLCVFEFREAVSYCARAVRGEWSKVERSRETLLVERTRPIENHVIPR